MSGNKNSSVTISKLYRDSFLNVFKESSETCNYSILVISVSLKTENIISKNLLKNLKFCS